MFIKLKWITESTGDEKAQSPIRKFLMSTVWPSIAEGFPFVRSRDKFIQKINNCQILEKCSWLVWRGVSSRPRDSSENFRIQRQTRRASRLKSGPSQILLFKSFELVKGFTWFRNQKYWVLHSSTKITQPLGNKQIVLPLWLLLFFLPFTNKSFPWPLREEAIWHFEKKNLIKTQQKNVSLLSLSNIYHKSGGCSVTLQWSIQHYKNSFEKRKLSWWFSVAGLKLPLMGGLYIFAN